MKSYTYFQKIVTINLIMDVQKVSFKFSASLLRMLWLVLNLLSILIAWDVLCQATTKLWDTRGHGKLRLSRWNLDKIDENEYIFMSPTFMQKCSKLCFSLKISALSKTPFPFLLLLKRKCINQKKLNVKTLSRPYMKRTHQSYQLWLGHLGMLRTQTEGVWLGI